MALCVMFVTLRQKNCWATSKHGRRLKFGISTVHMNIRSTKLLWLVEDDLQWKTPFGGRRLSVEDDLQCKRTFSARRPSVEDDLLWKTTFGGR